MPSSRQPSVNQASRSASPRPSPASGSSIPSNASMKREPSVSGALQVGLADLKVDRSPAASPLPSTPSGPATPSVRPKSGPQLIGELPLAREAAMRTFVELPANAYQYGTLGRSREAMEGMICDCEFSPG